MHFQSSIQAWLSRRVSRNLFLAFIVMLAALLPLTQPARVKAGPSPMAGSDMDTLIGTIDTYVEQERQAARVPGIALAIVADDRIVHLQGFGEADPSGRAVTAQTPFVIGSLGKSYTALAIMQLVEAGKLELDAPVQRYLPWFRVADAEASAQITVRHLLHHTSGLPKSVGNSEMATSRDMRDGALEEQVRSFSTAELTHPVGTTFQYSNAGYVTLGLLVQAVSGQSYERYVEQHIFRPLQMRHSFTDAATAKDAGLAPGYRYWFGLPVADDAPFNRRLLPAGFLISSAEDMAHYLIAHLNGGRYQNTTLLSSAGIAELQRGAVPVPGTDAQYGMGWNVGERNGMPVVAHTGDTAHYHGDLMLAPESGYGIALLMNSNNRITGERMRGIVDGILSLLHGQQPPPIEQNTSGTTVLRAVVALAVLLFLALIRSAIMVRRVARGAAGPAGWLAVLWHLVIPLVLFLLAALVFLVGVPMLFGYTWPLLLLTVPDIGTVALVSGVTALGWAVIRTGLMFRSLRRGTPRLVIPSAAPTTNAQTT